VPNTDKNRDKIKDLNKRMKEYGSRWRLSYKARKPVEGKKCTYGGGLRLEDAREIGIYIKQVTETSVSRVSLYEKIEQDLESANKKLDFMTKQRDKAKAIAENLWKNAIGADGRDWENDQCPVCTDVDIENTDDWVDSEEWYCNNCDTKWTCNKEVSRSDLLLSY
jgi:hypothetical protein